MAADTLERLEEFLAQPPDEHAHLELSLARALHPFVRAHDLDNARETAAILGVTKTLMRCGGCMTYFAETAPGFVSEVGLRHP